MVSSSPGNRKNCVGRVGSWVVVVSLLEMYVWEMLEVVYACTDLAIRTVYFCTSRWEEVSCLFHMIQKLFCLGATYIPRDYAVVPEYLRGEGDPEIRTVG